MNEPNHEPNHEPTTEPADEFPIQALEAFASRISRGGRVLCLDDRVAGWLSQRGIELQTLEPGKDLRFLSLPRESLAGIWAGSALAGFPIEESQRVIASFFHGLLPRTGVIFASHEYPETAFESMIRQNGFKVLFQARRQTRTAVVGVRI